jgi:hypothetical protein
LRRHWFKPNGERGDEGTAVKKVVTPAVKREAALHLKAHLGLSE